MDIWCFNDDPDSLDFSLGRVEDAGGTIPPEEWVVKHGVHKFPDAIYFFGDLDVDPDKTLYVISELSLGDVVYTNWGHPHPEQTPVGPFNSRQEAEDWAFEKFKGRSGTCSFTISPIVKPW